MTGWEILKKLPIFSVLRTTAFYEASKCILVIGRDQQPGFYSSGRDLWLFAVVLVTEHEEHMFCSYSCATKVRVCCELQLQQRVTVFVVSEMQIP